ncbi:MAG: phosphotransferase [Chloroflexi bacterium]|nr:phosphotransferase [Chloroflexota bacterium]
MPSYVDLFSRQHDKSKINSTYLSELAGIALSDDAVSVSAWDCEPVHGGFGGAIGGTALYRFILTIDSSSLSLVLKILQRRKGETGHSPYYWKREFEIYRAGMLEELPAGSFDMPRVYRVDDHGDNCWIWMEDIEDRGGDWSLEDFANIAERLGRLNGAWLCGRALPRATWLSKSWHSAIVPALADAFSQLDQLLDNPLAQITLPLDAKEEVMAIWRDREQFRLALSKLPSTFCHYDAFRRNILHGRDRIFLIDWALAGVGGVGEDLVSLVAVSLYYKGFTQTYASKLDDIVFANYVNGLREAGWQGDQRQARIGYTCGMTLRGLAGVKQDINLLADSSNHDQLRQNNHTDSLEDIARFFAEIRQFRLLKMAREARSLLAR